MFKNYRVFFHFLLVLLLSNLNAARSVHSPSDSYVRSKLNQVLIEIENIELKWLSFLETSREVEIQTI